MSRRVPEPWIGSAEWWRQTAAALALVAALAILVGVATCEAGCGPPGPANSAATTAVDVSAHAGAKGAPWRTALDEAARLAGWVLVSTIGLSLLLHACGCGPSPAACTPQQLAAIEAEYVAEALRLCAGMTYADCPFLPTLRARAEERRQAWVRCEGR